MHYRRFLFPASVFYPHWGISALSLSFRTVISITYLQSKSGLRIMLFGCIYSHQFSHALQRASPSPVTSPCFVSLLPSHSPWLQLHLISPGQLSYLCELEKWKSSWLILLALLKAEEVHNCSQAFLLVFGFLLLCVFPDCLSKLVP